jgi:fructan beta-fructosidase
MSIMKINASLLLAMCFTACQQPKNPTDALDSTAYLNEKYRPQFHFTPERNWMNDPNGMVYYEGEYHLFYQHYPDGNVWGPMHWGHAVSKDLVSWEHLPIALYPDSLGLIFSGSAVIDFKNTSGLGAHENPPMVAIFTQHLMEGEKSGRHDFQTQGIAYSLDKGRTWKMYDKNPVIKNPGKHDFRDPKVFWHEASHQWVVILAVKDHVELYGSPDLKAWKHLSDFGNAIGAHGGVWECPDLFEIEVAGTGNKKWVMLVSMNPGAANGGSGTQYFIGQFDGKSFHPDTENSHWLDYGKDNYAGVTWSNTSEAEGRKLFIGWMSNWQYATVVPTTAWRSAMTVPRRLTLVETEAGLRVASQPVDEFKILRKDTVVYIDFLKASQIESENLKLNEGGQEIDVHVLQTSSENGFELTLSNQSGEQLGIGLDGATHQFYMDRTHSGTAFSKDFVGKHIGIRSSSSKDIQLTLLIDASSVELFADNGTLVMTDLFFPSSPFTLLKIKSAKGIAIDAVTVHRLKSIWQRKEN